MGAWHETDGMTMRREAGGHLGSGFSRESGGGEVVMQFDVCLRH
jgi:hypothetical protein